MINGRDYDHEAVVVSLPFGPDFAVKNINYKASRPVQLNYARGTQPKGYGRQNYEGTGSMEVDSRSWKEFLVFAAIQGGISEIPAFVITVKYENADQGLMIDVIDGVLIEDVETTDAQGEGEVAMYVMNFKVANTIKFNGVPF